MHRELVSIDIGSTYTKGALFNLTGASLALKHQAAVPTTPEDLQRGFGHVFTKLTGLPYGVKDDELKEVGVNRHIAKQSRSRGLDSIKVRFSSSAKGGLRIAAVGLVPDLTLQIARLAAWSAGGKIVADTAYRIRETQVQTILNASPDIILFTGGTDGGNEEIVLWNARQLARCPFSGTILYAGNQSLRREIEHILGGKRVVFTPNVMPRVGQIQIEETRKAIQRIFLDTIVEGRGLQQVQEFCGTEPVPTPASVFDLVEAIANYQAGIDKEPWEPFCVIDLGGATTDVYSIGEAFYEGEGMALKGLREPRIKRTVEGDLGMRISVPALWDTVKSYFPEVRTSLELKANIQEMEQYVAKVGTDSSYLPQNPQEDQMDTLLAILSSVVAVARHAGEIQETFIPSGRVLIQTGKDLRPMKRIIGSGGYLSRYELGKPLQTLFQQVYKGGCRGNGLSAFTSPNGVLPLVPLQARYYRDSQYLFPLLGNFAQEYPREVVTLAIETLEPKVVEG